MQLTEKQLEIIDTKGNLLVTGGPGSGKTTVSILKAAKIAENDLLPGQKILFLSFARATVSRVVEAIEFEQAIPHEQKKRINVETYHSFFWRILKAHGYLVGLPRRLSILSPPNEAIALSAIRSDYPTKSKLTVAQKSEKQTKEDEELLRRACDDGEVCFDLFARYAGDILQGSKRICKLIATMSPVIILDEFQDTNAEQWRVVRTLGKHCTLLALADPEQRIYDWIGADPERLNNFIEAFAPTEITLGGDNHRSAGTDIAAFGNDILSGVFNKKTYTGIQVCTYPPNENQAFSRLITATYEARKRLVNNKDWSLAILVPTKKMTRLVSDAFLFPPAGMTEIYHTAVIEMEATILSAEIIAFLMQPDKDGCHFENFITLICNYFHGKGGSNPSKSSLNEAENIKKAYKDWCTRQASGKTIKKKSILIGIRNVYNASREIIFTGNPDHDWRMVRRTLEDGPCPRLNAVAKEARNLRLLGRGTQLRQELSQNWRDYGAYTMSLAIVQQSFIQDHFSTTSKPESGVVIMNMHKAKGKQFDEVIIFEGWPLKKKGKIIYNPDRIVPLNSRDLDDNQARQNLRVSITRGKLQTTILTPNNDPCILLIPSN